MSPLPREFGREWESIYVEVRGLYLWRYFFTSLSGIPPFSLLIPLTFSPVSRRYGVCGKVRICTAYRPSHRRSAGACHGNLSSLVWASTLLPIYAESPTRTIVDVNKYGLTFCPATLPAYSAAVLARLTTREEITQNSSPVQVQLRRWTWCASPGRGACSF
ncbi:hypothetical protein C8R47DRAFT_1109400 [Mycena vitilis]|nr:hypothetical protein C8R47DRAFT_1109400 [Mycena vitilis]